MQELDCLADPVVCALDPGLHTGVALYRHGGLPGMVEHFSSGEIEGRFEFYDTFDEIVAMGVPLIVVCESFTITGATAQKSPQPDALYIIGAVERQCHKLGLPFHLQPPSAKAFAPDNKLHAVSWFAPGKGHANDAARHALKFIVANDVDGSVELLAQVVDGLGLAL